MCLVVQEYERAVIFRMGENTTSLIQSVHCDDDILFQVDWEQVAHAVMIFYDYM